MQAITVEESSRLLRVLRLDRPEALGEYASKILALAEALEVLHAQRRMKPSARSRATITRELCEQAIHALAPSGKQGNPIAGRDHILLDHFYLQHQSRAETLQVLGLDGGSFDRIKAHATPRFAEALGQVCADISRLVPSSDESADSILGRVPAAWVSQSPVRKGRNLGFRPYRVLWGREREIQEITSSLSGPAAAPITSVSGLGGTGKTALVREIAERLSETGQFADVLWESARRLNLVGMQIQQVRDSNLDFAGLVDSFVVQTGLAEVANKNLQEKTAALAGLFRSRSYLIVLDNMEESQNEVEIVRQFVEILGNSRLLITTRHRHLDDLPLVRPLHLQGLEIVKTEQFLREEAAYHGLKRLAGAPVETLGEIYKLTGGAPLALNLVIGQMHSWSLEDTLGHLRAASERDKDFYTYLFWQDWQTLSVDAQKLLIYIGRMIPTSISQAHLRWAGLATQGMDAGLAALVKLSLLETNESLTEADKRYSMHSLVRHFVLSDLPDLWKTSQN